MRAATLALLFAVATQCMRGASVVDFRRGVVELALGSTVVMLPSDDQIKTAVSAGAAFAGRWNLVGFAEWTQLPTSGKGNFTVQGQILCAGVQYQIARFGLPARAIPYVEGGFSLADLQLVRLPINDLHDNDAGTRPGWVAGGGVRIPFGREARAGLKLGYRHIGQPGTAARGNVHEFSAQLSIFLRPR
jgi:hypothetical protein